MKQINGDWWPDRDKTCFQSSYTFSGADLAISFCKKRDLVIQAGGNVGVWPRYLRSQFGRVITAEPSLENYLLMIENVPVDLGVEMWNVALGEKAGKCGLRLNPDNCGDDQTVPGSEVPVVAIDDFHVDPDLIYLDIQGDELPALRGAVQTLVRCSPVVAIEVDGYQMRRHGDARPFLKNLGYRCVDRAHQDEIFVRDL